MRSLKLVVGSKGQFEVSQYILQGRENITKYMDVATTRLLGLSQ